MCVLWSDVSLVHIRGTRERRTWLDVENHLHSFFPEWNHCTETSEIEIVFDEILSDLAEILVAWEGAEPGDPSQGRGWS